LQRGQRRRWSKCSWLVTIQRIVRGSTPAARMLARIGAACSVTASISTLPCGDVSRIALTVQVPTYHTLP
jgi:hypothetical protein